LNLLPRLKEGQTTIEHATEGELYLTGVGLGLGYFRRPDLTEQAFLPLPTGTFGPNAAKLAYSAPPCYKTGDVVRWTAERELTFVGRVDNQVKINGQRVELGEIEAILKGAEGVQEAVVVLYREDDEPPILSAFYSPESVSADALLQYASSQLPKHMVPASFTGMGTWPRNSNSKIDRRALQVIKPIDSPTVMHDSLGQLRLISATAAEVTALANCRLLLAVFMAAFHLLRCQHPDFSKAESKYLEGWWTDMANYATPSSQHFLLNSNNSSSTAAATSSQLITATTALATACVHRLFSATFWRLVVAEHTSPLLFFVGFHDAVDLDALTVKTRDIVLVVFFVLDDGFGLFHFIGLWWLMPFLFARFTAVLLGKHRYAGYLLTATLFAYRTTLLRSDSCPSFLEGSSPWRIPFFYWLGLECAPFLRRVFMQRLIRWAHTPTRRLLAATCGILGFFACLDVPMPIVLRLQNCFLGEAALRNATTVLPGCLLLFFALTLACPPTWRLNPWNTAGLVLFAFPQLELPRLGWTIAFYPTFLDFVAVRVWQHPGYADVNLLLLPLCFFGWGFAASYIYGTFVEVLSWCIRWLATAVAESQRYTATKKHLEGVWTSSSNSKSSKKSAPGRP